MADQATIVEIPLTSSTRSVTLPFDYLTRSAVVLTIKQTNDVTFSKVLKLTDDYRFTGLTEVTLNGDYSGFGDRLEIKRHTPATRLVDFRDGSVLTANSLNISQLQAIHIAEEGRFEITTEIRQATADAQRFAKQAEESAKDSKTYRDATQQIWDGILDSIEAAGDKSTLGYLATPAGYSAIGAFISFDALRLSKPQHDGQRVKLESYYAGKYLGGGEFVGHLTTATDDGGTIAAGPSHHWKRTGDKSELNVTHFGALMDGVSDDMPAVIRMHNWSRSVDVTFGPGIVFPAGKTALSHNDFGDAEIPAFKIRGPEVSYGRIPSLQIVPFNKTNTGYIFRFKARRMEVANLYVNGVGTVAGFMENTVTRGDYCRIHAVQARDMGGRMFHVWDTIDTKLDQCYSSRGKAAFFRTDWSNESPGAWDHPTAIEISNCNFEAHTGEYAVSAIRAGQSEMNNVWFDRNENGFDISQGGWILKNVTQENSKNPSGAKWAKVVTIACRFAQGAGLSEDVSGYDPSWDPSGKPPTWVTNAYDQGIVNMDPHGMTHTQGVAEGFKLPLTGKTRYLNSTGQEKWILLGRVTQNGTQGATFEIELQGANGWDSIPDALNHPGSTGFGGGRALIRGQLKQNVATTTSLQLSWHGEGACPIKEVRYVHGWQNFEIYVRMGAFCRVMASFLRGDGVGRLNAGQPFYYRFGSDEAVDINAVANLRIAKKEWSINGGTAGSGQNNTGFGMDLDNGMIVMASPEVGNAAGRYIQIKNNYQDRYIPTQATMESTRINRYARAALPAPDGENAFSIILCTDSGAGSGASTQMELLYSDGTGWRRSKDGSAVTRG